MDINQLRLELNRWFRRFFYDQIYYRDWLTKDLRFFNLGLSPVDPVFAFALSAPTEQHQAQVYLEAIKAFQRHAPLAVPERILEVSTGLGGGLLALSYSFPSAQIFGLDYSRTSVRRSKRLQPLAQLVMADAHSSAFADRSFPLIVNIESFHAFSAIKFLAEARRILTTDGYLIVIDFRKVPAEPLQQWVVEQAAMAGLCVVEFIDLTKNAIASARTDVSRRNVLLQRVPAPFRKLVNEMTAGEGSDLLKQYLSGEKTYFLCVLKPRPASHSQTATADRSVRRTNKPLGA